MNTTDFNTFIKNNKIELSPPPNDTEIILTNNTLQRLRFAALPKFMIDLYKKTSNMTLNNAYIFGAKELLRPKAAPIPSIVEINKDLSIAPNLSGKTIFGKNDLFFFAFDSFGTCFMLDNLSLKTLKTYDNPLHAIYDCLVIGKLK